MHKTLLTLLSGLLVPAFVLALDFDPVVGQYRDEPFGRAEGAAISLLTRHGIVQGNPNDQMFHPERTLNRAEFAKVVVESYMGEVFNEVGGDCFPDVRATDWFSRYVCYMKSAGYIQGYPDGKFHPERPVNYAEAVKMLVNKYGYEL